MFAPKIQQFTHLGWSTFAARGAKNALTTQSGGSAGSAGASQGGNAAGGTSWNGKAFYALTQQTPSTSTTAQNSADDDQDRNRPNQKRFRSHHGSEPVSRYSRTRRHSVSGRNVEAAPLQSPTLRQQFKRAFSTAAPSAPSTPSGRTVDLPRTVPLPTSPVRRRRHSTSAIETSRPYSPFLARTPTPPLAPEHEVFSVAALAASQLRTLLSRPAERARNDVRQIIEMYRTQPFATLDAHTAAFEAMLHIRPRGRPLYEAFALFNEMPSKNLPWKPETIELAIQTLCTREREVADHLDYLLGRSGAHRPTWVPEDRSNDYWSTSTGLTIETEAEISRLRDEDNFRHALELYLTHWRRLDTATANALLAQCATQQSVHEGQDFDAVATKIMSCLDRSALAAPSAMSYVHVAEVYRAQNNKDAVLDTFESYQIAKKAGTIDSSTRSDAIRTRQQAQTFHTHEISTLSIPVSIESQSPRQIDTPEQLLWACVIGTLFNAGETVEGLTWLGKMLADESGLTAGQYALRAVVAGFARNGDVDSARRWLQKVASSPTTDEKVYLMLTDAVLSELSGMTHHSKGFNAVFADLSETSRQHGFRYEAHRWWPTAMNVNLVALEDASPEERKTLLIAYDQLSQRVMADHLESHATSPLAEVSAPLSMRLARAFAQSDMRDHAADIHEELARRVWATLMPSSQSQSDPETIAAKRAFLRHGAYEIAGISADGESQQVPADSLSLQSALRLCRSLWSIDLRPAGALAQLVAAKFIDDKMAKKIPQLEPSDWAFLLDACAVALVSPSVDARHLRVFEMLVEDIVKSGAPIEQSPTMAWTAATITSALPAAQAAPLIGRLMHANAVLAQVDEKAALVSDSGVSDISGLPSPVLSNWTPPPPSPISTVPAYLESPRSHPTLSPSAAFDDQLTLILLGAPPKQRDISLARLEQALADGRLPRPSAIAKLIDILASDPSRDAKALRRAQVERLYGIAYNALSLLSDDPQSEIFGTEWAAIEDSMLMAQAHFGELEKVAVHRDRLISAGRCPSADAYATMILNLRDTTDDATVAVETYHEARRLGVVPNAFLYNTLISRLSRARRAADALMYFHEMRSLGVEPTSVTYGSLINACCKTGDEAQARQLFDDMVKSPRYVPRHPPFNTMIQFFQSRGDRASALEYFDRLMQARVPPTDHTYRLLIDVYGAIEPIDPASARDVFRMLARDQAVSVQGMHWAALITMYGSRQQDIDATLRLFESIASYRSSPSAPTAQPDPLVYEALFDALRTCHRTDLLGEYTDRMHKAGVPMTAYTANALIKAHGSAGDLEAARAVFNSLEDPRGGVAGHSAHHHNPRMHPEPSRSRMLPIDHIYREPSTYEALIEAEMQAGHRDRATALYDQAVRRAFPIAVLEKLLRSINVH